MKKYDSRRQKQIEVESGIIYVKYNHNNYKKYKYGKCERFGHKSANCFSKKNLSNFEQAGTLNDSNFVDSEKQILFTVDGTGNKTWCLDSLTVEIYLKMWRRFKET